MASPPKYATLSTDQTQLILYIQFGAQPHIVYWGPALTNSTPEEIALLSERQWAFGGPNLDIQPSLSNEIATGLSGPPGIILDRDGLDWDALFTVEKVSQQNDHELKIQCRDTQAKISICYEISLCPEIDVFTVSTSLTNETEMPLRIDWCTALCLPLEQHFDHMRSFKGKWAYEFQHEDISTFRGSFVRENKSGRTGHDTFPALLAFNNTTNETNGLAAGFHLGWSGNSRLRVDHQADGRAFLQMGELFFPGEMVLAKGETYRTPPLYGAQSKNGFNSVSQKFHDHLNHKIMDGRILNRPRKVHYNTWEAVYFDHSEEKLIVLAEKAAEIGAERFVLDDGWFGGRRNDSKGLGDWWVSKDVYPNGLHRLASRVRDLNMEFGIWVEPEMVNPDSDLFREHPDWILEIKGTPQIPSRNQFVLDLTRQDVTEYLYEKICTIIKTYDVTYLKWDMNRDIHHPGSQGRAVTSAQTRAVYQLMRRMRDTFPRLEIESCSSGGARADYGVLQYTDRIWTSDSNDALDRQNIQRGASYFLPLNVMGAHVGPEKCHITGRRLSMALRAATAFFGHMGMELNLLEERQEDLAILKKSIALHKQHRNLLHTGQFFRQDGPESHNIIGVVSRDKTEAIYSCTKLTHHSTTLPGLCKFTGLNSDQRYRIKIIWPLSEISPTAPSILESAKLLDSGSVFSGEALMRHGIQLPLMMPESNLIYYLEAIKND